MAKYGWRPVFVGMVREFQSATSAIMSGGLMENAQAQQTSPFAIISVDCHGNFSTFSPELLGLTSEDYGDFTFGNVMTDTFDSILSTPKFTAVAQDIAAGIRRCRETCEYFAYCGGGAPVNKYFENGSFDSTETMFCRLSKQAVLNVVLEKLETMVAALLRVESIPKGEIVSQRREFRAHDFDVRRDRCLFERDQPLIAQPARSMLTAQRAGTSPPFHTRLLDLGSWNQYASGFRNCLTRGFSVNLAPC